MTRMMVDATVAQSISISGESRALAIIRKTQAVDLLHMRDTLRALGLKTYKVPSAKNLSDLWTKCVSGQTLSELKKEIGREAGHAERFEIQK